MSVSEHYFVREGKVFVPATPWFEERMIGELPEANQQHVLSAMQDRFQELIDKTNELQKEFSAGVDKIKHAGKLVRTKSYICSAKAIGDYAGILKLIDQMEAEIKTEVDRVLELKDQLCKEAEALLETKEWKDATDKLREIQKQFRELPMVPDLKNEDLKHRFEKAKDEFFRLKQASFESFEQDLLDNLDKKTELCEKAEALQHSVEWKKTTDAYQQLNEEWKKIGMVPKHRIEELWFRFSTAKDIFFNRKREHIEEIKTEQGDNLSKKLELVAKAEALKESKDWKKTTDAFNQLMEDWKKTGRVMAEKSDEVWNQFLEAKNHFFKNKDAYYSGIRVQLEDNYARKMAIVNHAEELQQTMDFELATKEFMDMFDEWKTIGRIPKEYGDEPWDRFMKAKKNFFDRKDSHREQRKQEVSKDLQERIIRNRGFYNKVSRELQREEELLFDVNDRLANLPPTLRSYEKREELKDMVTEIEEKIQQLKAKVKDVKDKIHQDEREMNYILRGPKKKEAPAKEEGSKKNAKQQVPAKAEQAATEPTTEEPVVPEEEMQPQGLESDSLAEPLADDLPGPNTESAPELPQNDNTDTSTEPGTEPAPTSE